MSTDRYKFSTVKKDENGKRYDKDTIIPTIPAGDNDTYIISRDGDRLDLLSHRFYGDSTLWWIIAEANGLKDSFFITPGTKLRIPANPQDAVDSMEQINQSR